MSSFAFGLDHQDLALKLRELADKVDSQEVIVTSATSSTRITTNDYEVKHLVIRYHERNG